MRARPRRVAGLSSLAVLAGGMAWGQALPLEPLHDAGASVTGAFEGWFQNKDGSYNLLLGYYSRNQKQTLDIPIGPDNRIEPGGPDRGQPTTFLPGRQWGMFVIKVPADFGDAKLTWTIVANGQTTVIPASLKPDYEVSPLEEAAVGNTPPFLGFEEHGPTAQGPAGVTANRTAKAGVPLPITVWASDDGKFTSSSGARSKTLGPPIALTWRKFRGPGKVTFGTNKPPVEFAASARQDAGVSGKAETTATFSEPGDYILHVQANDYSGEGGGGFQCCWTNGEVKVTVGR
ncbi:MAG: hypothetical protein LAP40_12880 [Acidobacteriia bacterium]|nr:hypothetical protein [Terriglobia bacterium]